MKESLRYASDEKKDVDTSLNNCLYVVTENLRNHSCDVDKKNVIKLWSKQVLCYRKMIKNLIFLKVRCLMQWIENDRE